MPWESHEGRRSSFYPTVEVGDGVWGGVVVGLDS